jgi:hypothetical protein
MVACAAEGGCGKDRNVRKRLRRTLDRREDLVSCA